MAPMLEVKSLVAKYGDFQALFGIDFEMARGSIVALIGANGAGKSTFLKAIAGQMPNKQGEIRFEGRDIAGLPSEEIVAAGIAMVPEGRRLFRSLTVEENLKVGAFSGRAGRWTLDAVYALFPVLNERRQSPATALSGGQQQMVAIGRALMSNPDLLLCDEVSLGLAPAIIKDIYAIFPVLRAEGLSLVIVEQDIDTALRVADDIYCFMHGRVTLQGSPATVGKGEISAAHFGLEERAHG
jgi:branched-chain amino acid transport system ATP-binding protein